MEASLDNLIRALTIFKQYGNISYPTGCSHDELRVYVPPENVSEADIIVLDRLGFFVDEEHDCFLSFRYGSA
jgi:hypothetical protein